MVESSPKLHEGGIVVGSYDRYVYKLAAKDGQLVWKYKTGGYVHSTAALDEDGTVYIGSTDDNLYAIKQKTYEVPAESLHDEL